MLTCPVVPGRRSSKVPVVPRERSPTEGHGRRRQADEP
jgi:hypothetical protein